MATQFTLPRDAEGREIPRNTEVMYDANGKKLHTTSFTYKCDVLGLWAQWKVFSPDIKSDDGMLPIESLYLTSPDSLKKLEEDLKRVTNNEGEFGSMACAYMNQSDCTCVGCRFDIANRPNCLDRMVEDVISRIHNLGNED